MAELDSQPKTLQTIYTWYAQDKLYVNRRYQRKLVWTLHEKQKLIESVLSELPIPAVLMAERDGGSYEIIDGLQRLHTLMSFVEVGFSTEDGKYFDTARFLTADDRRKAGGFSLPEPEKDDQGVERKLELLASSEVARYLD